MAKLVYVKKAPDKNSQQKPTSNQSISIGTADKLHRFTGCSLPCGDGEVKQLRFKEKRII